MVKIMAFDGLKKFFNTIGGFTVDSSQKVGKGVQAPVERIGGLRSERKIMPRRKSETDSKSL